MPMGGDQGMGGQGRGQNRAGPAMAGAMGQGGRGEYGVIQTAGPAMEGTFNNIHVSLCHYTSCVIVVKNDFYSFIPFLMSSL